VLQDLDVSLEAIDGVVNCKASKSKIWDNVLDDGECAVKRNSAADGNEKCRGDQGKKFHVAHLAWTVLCIISNWELKLRQGPLPDEYECLNSKSLHAFRRSPSLLSPSLAVFAKFYLDVRNVFSSELGYRENIVAQCS
jgi:hypothetical protein